MPQPQAILETRGIHKRFPGVKALTGVDFRLFPGEVHALMGENGAGKSTLIKVLTGVYTADGGTVLLDGAPVRFTSPAQAQRAGVSTVYQEVNLCQNLSVAENIYIGREPRTAGLIRWKSARARALELLTRFQLDLDVTAPLGSYSLAIQQLVAIVRAVDISTKVLILDEPTSSLDGDEVVRLFDVIRRLRSEGVAILFVSHFIDQIYEVSDRVTVLRNGAMVREAPIAELPHLELVREMIGKDLAVLEELGDAARHDEPSGLPLLRASGVGRRGSIAPFDLDLHPGEVIGLAGLLGSGRTEVARLMFGADRPDTGRFTMDGRATTIRTPRAAIASGIAFCPENRKTEGLVEDLTIRDNIILALQAARGWTRPLPARRREELVDRYILALRISPPNPDMLVRNLSGGNQQRVLLARWLITQPRLLILDEPTRGIDIGAKAEIQRLVVSLSREGMAVLFISAELEEVLRLSHRVAVLRDRRLIEQRANDGTLTADVIMRTIASGADPGSPVPSETRTETRTEVLPGAQPEAQPEAEPGAHE